MTMGLEGPTDFHLCNQPWSRGDETSNLSELLLLSGTARSVRVGFLTDTLGILQSRGWADIPLTFLHLLFTSLYLSHLRKVSFLWRILYKRDEH